MAIKLEDKTNVLGPNGTYPFGNIKDDTGAKDGTPVNVAVYADFHQFFAKLLSVSGITANGLPDNATNTFQYIESLINVLNSSIGNPIMKALLQNYTTGDLSILWGCVVNYVPSGTSTITAGAIYYNGKIYNVASQSIASTPGVVVFKINTTVNPNVIYISATGTGTGIADYNASTIKPFYSETNAGGTINVTSGNFSIGVNSNIKYIRNGSQLMIEGLIVLTSNADQTVALSFNVAANNSRNVARPNAMTIGFSGIGPNPNTAFIVSGNNGWALFIDSSGRVVMGFDSEGYTNGQTVFVQFVLTTGC